MSETPTIVSGDPIKNDLSCFKCEYNLRTLPRDGRCPECGEPVAQSIAFHFGDHLNLRRLSIGATVLLAGPWIFPATAIVVAITGMASQSDVLGAGCSATGGILSNAVPLVAVWVIVTSRRMDQRQRDFARLCVFAAAALLLLRSIGDYGTFVLESLGPRRRPYVALTWCHAAMAAAFSIETTLLFLWQRYCSRWLVSTTGAEFWLCRILLTAMVSLAGLLSLIEAAAAFRTAISGASGSPLYTDLWEMEFFVGLLILRSLQVLYWSLYEGQVIEKRRDEHR